jgi:hypothetical protein
MASPLTASIEKPANFDTLRLPDGRSCGDVRRGGDLARLLQRLGVPGVSPQNGRSENLAAYSVHLQAIREEGARNAVAAWAEKARSLVP